MEIYPLIQARLLLLTALLGAIVGVMCDTLRLMHREIKIRWLSSVWRFIGDVAAVGVSFVGIALLNYRFNKGILRIFPFLGFFVGFFTYRHTLSYVVCPIVKWIMTVTKAIFRMILYPLVKISRILAIFLEKIKYYIIKTLEKIFVLVYNIYVRKKLKRAARKGFIIKTRMEKRSDRDGREKVFYR